MKWLVLVLVLLGVNSGWACSSQGQSCGATLTCCAGLVCISGGCKVGTTTTTVPTTTTTTTTQPGSTTTTTLPPFDPNVGVFQPTYADVSIRYHDPQLFFRGFQLDQAGRDKMVEQQWDYTPEAIIAARAIGCTQQASSGCNAQTDVLTRFSCCGPYDNIIEGQTWEITEQGADNLYDVPRSILKNIQSCATSSSKSQACAASPLFHKGLRDLLDISISGDRCVLGGDFVDISHPEFVQGGPGDDGVGIARNVNVGKPDAEALAKLDALMMAHHMDVEWKCGRGPLPSMSVLAAMFDFQMTPYCQASEDRRHFCQLKVFHGTADPLYTPEEVCANAELTHVFMTKWGDAIKTGQWGPVRQMDTAHKAAHRCVVLKCGYQIRLPCGKTHISDCPKLTCAQAIEQYVR